jgi:type I restriction enzyme S subunit
MPNWPISIPVVSEQRRIVAILDEFNALTTDLSTHLHAELNARRKQYEYYRDVS